MSSQLLKTTVEAAPGPEMEPHPGYPKHSPRGRGNSRNGRSRKRLKSDHGEVEIETPRDRVGGFELHLVEIRSDPHDDAALKVVYPAIEKASHRWTRPVQNWKGALQRFMIEFPERLDGHIQPRAFTQNFLHSLTRLERCMAFATPDFTLTVAGITTAAMVRILI